MKPVSCGNTVRIHYTAKIKDDRVLNTTVSDNSLQFTIGADHVLSEIEQSVIGMRVGDVRNIAISGNNLFGPCYERNFMTIPREKLPQQTLTIGRRIKIPGQRFSVKVIEVSESTVIIDLTHPLCAKELLFEIKLLAIL